MSVRRSLSWMILSQAGFFIIQFGGSVVLSRLLTPYEMGVYAAASALIGILSVLQAFGVALFVIREAEIDQATLSSAFTVNALLSLLLSLVIVALSSTGALLLHAPGVRQVMLVLAATPLIGIFEFLPAVRLERDGAFQPIAVVSLLRAAVTTSVTVALAVFGYGYMSFPYGAVLAATASAAAFMIVGRQHVSFRVGLTAWRHIVRFGLQQLAIQGINTIGGRAAEFILGRLLGLDALGLYGRASNLNNLVWTNIHMVAGRVLLVSLAEQHRKTGELRDDYLRIVEVMTAFLWPIFAGLAVLAGPLIRIVYGQAWIAAAPPFAALAVSAILLVSITMTWEIFVIKNETGRQARFEFIRTAFGFTMFIAGCFLSLTAAASARIAEAVFSILIYRPHIERMTSTRLSDYIWIYIRSGTLTLTACAPAICVMAIYRWSPAVPLSWVFVAIAAGALLWALALRLTDHQLSREFGALWAKAVQTLGRGKSVSGQSS